MEEALVLVVIALVVLVGPPILAISAFAKVRRLEQTVAALERRLASWPAESPARAEAAPAVPPAPVVAPPAPEVVAVPAARPIDVRPSPPAVVTARTGFDWENLIAGTMAESDRLDGRGHRRRVLPEARHRQRLDRAARPGGAGPPVRHGASGVGAVVREEGSRLLRRRPHGSGRRRSVPVAVGGGKLLRLFVAGHGVCGDGRRHGGHARHRDGPRFAAHRDDGDGGRLPRALARQHRPGRASRAVQRTSRCSTSPCWSSPGRATGGFSSCLRSCSLSSTSSPGTTASIRVPA